MHAVMDSPQPVDVMKETQGRAGQDVLIGSRASSLLILLAAHDLGCLGGRSRNKTPQSSMEGGCKANERKKDVLVIAIVDWGPSGHTLPTRSNSLSV